MKKEKFCTVKVSGVIICIGKTTELPGYSETVVERLLPSDEDLANWTDEEHDAWIAKNNKFMESLCKLMNENKNKLEAI